MRPTLMVMLVAAAAGVAAWLLLGRGPTTAAPDASRAGTETLEADPPSSEPEQPATTTTAQASATVTVAPTPSETASEPGDEPMPAAPADDEPAPDPRRFERLYEGPVAWKDGDATRYAYADPRMLFEKLPGRMQDGQPLPPVAGAVLVRDERDGRLWRVPEGTHPARVLEDLAEQEAAGIYSPMFSENPNGGGRLLALAGGVLVQFPAEWDAARTTAWAEAHGVKGMTPLTIGPGWYSVPSGPGPDALDLAARLVATGDLLVASPDWWRQKVLR